MVKHGVRPPNTHTCTPADRVRKTYFERCEMCVFVDAFVCAHRRCAHCVVSGCTDDLFSGTFRRLLDIFFDLELDGCQGKGDPMLFDLFETRFEADFSTAMASRDWPRLHKLIVPFADAFCFDHEGRRSAGTLGHRFYDVMSKVDASIGNATIGDGLQAVLQASDGRGIVNRGGLILGIALSVNDALPVAQCSPGNLVLTALHAHAMESLDKDLAIGRLQGRLDAAGYLAMQGLTSNARAALWYKRHDLRSTDRDGRHTKFLFEDDHIALILGMSSAEAVRQLRHRAKVGMWTAYHKAQRDGGVSQIACPA
jgi:hypothetical protein